MGIKAQWVRPWIATTRDSNFSSELHNILNEQFNPQRPNAVWCTDITYIGIQDGFVYLTNIMDLYTRKIIAWTLSDTMVVSCVIDTIHKAKAHHNTDLPLIIHISILPHLFLNIPHFRFRYKVICQRQNLLKILQKSNNRGASCHNPR